jgi:hypothetical protein
VCRTKNVLYEAGISTLPEIKKQDPARIAKRVITNKSHPIRSYFINNKIHDEYAITSNFITGIEYLGELQIDVRKSKQKINQSFAQSQRDQVASDSGRNSKNTGRKIHRTYKNLHGRLQKGRKGWVRGDNTRP